MTERDKAKRDTRGAGAYGKIESHFRDLVKMGRIAADLADETDGGPSLCDKRELALVGGYHLGDMPLRFELKGQLYT